MKLKTNKPKSKAEILEEMKKNHEFRKKMKFTKEVFYPELVNVSDNIQDAIMLLSGLGGMILSEFLEGLKGKKFSELNLEEKLAKDNPKHEQFKKFLAIFNDLSAFEAKDLIEGMKQEIELFIKEENETRSLSSLKTKWVDEK